MSKEELNEVYSVPIRVMSEDEMYANAYTYAAKIPNKSSFDEFIKLRHAHEAGAHSRDPEIKELKAQLDHEKEMAKYCTEDLKQEIEDLKAELAKVKKEKDLLSSAYNIVQSELDGLKWNDASKILPPREVDGGSYSILVATSCDDSKEHYYLDRYDYQAKRWMYNTKSKVLKWRIEF